MNLDHSNDGNCNDEHFEQLCALAAIGEVSASEFAELNEHLAVCGSCRETCADFRRIASNELGAVATGRWSGGEAGADLDEPVLLARVLQRAQQETVAVTPDPVPNRVLRPRPALFGFWSMLRSPALTTAALALLMSAAVGVGAYRYRGQQLEPAMAELDSELNQRESEVNKAGAQATSASALLQQNLSERDALQKSLVEARKNYLDLLNRDKVLEGELASAQEKLEAQGGQLRAANAAAQQSGDSLHALQAQLHDAVARTTLEENLVDQLQRKLHRAEENASVAAVSPVPDGDAKEIFGARDLHIVDVYDVDSTGKTKRGFGRVYFVEKKLLLFYAFDLQDKQRQRVAAAFQAWGYRQGNEDKPQNLGLFLMDDPSISRWVLKVNNSSVLERVDAVFVTLEPPSGSPSPRGRKLLYANLGGPPNHP